MVLIQNTYSYRQPKVQIDVDDEDRVENLDLPNHAIRLKPGQPVAAIFPQLLNSDTLEALKNDKEDPLKIPPEHDSTKLESAKLLSKKHLHIIVQKPDIGESHYVIVAA